MIKQELIQKAKSLPQEERKKILLTLSDKEILESFVKTLKESEENGNYYLQKEEIYFEKETSTGRLRECFFIYRGDIRADTIQEVSHIEERLKSFENAHKYVLLLLGDSSQTALSRIRSLKESRLEVLKYEEIEARLIEFLPEIFFDTQKISFLSNQIVKLENEHWLSEKGFQLSEVFTDPLLSTIEIENLEELSEESIKRRKVPFVWLKNEILHNNKILLKGEPGSGKTSLLAKLVIESYKEIIRQLSEKKIETIYLPALFKATEFIKFESSIEIIKHFYEVHEKIQIQTILIDALDELSTEERTELIQKAENFAKELNSNLLITTRTDQLPTETIQNFKQYELLPFGFQQAFQIFQKIYSKQKLSTKNFQEVKNIIQETISKVAENLPLTPISLILLAEIIEEAQEIPASIVKLYEKYFELILGTLDKKKGLEILFDSEIKEKFLSHLAFEEFFSKGRLEIEEEDFEKYFENYNNKFKSLGNILKFKQELRRAQVLKLDNGKVFFRHRSFLEYFVGLYIYKNRDEIPNITEYLVKLYFDATWNEVPLYYFGFVEEIKQSFLERLFSYKQQSEVFSLLKLLTGRLLQAAWHSESEVKKFGIKEASSFIHSSKKFLLSKIKNITSRTHTEFFLEQFLFLVCEESFSSTFLRQEILQILNELLDKESPTYLQILGLYSALERFLDSNQNQKIIYKLLEKLEKDKSLTKEEKLRYLISLDVFDRDDKTLRHAIRKQIKKQIGKPIFIKPSRSFAKERQQISMLEEKIFIESIQISHFTCFQNNEISFSSGLNFFIGENASGKTHLLKVLYSSLSSLQRIKSLSVPSNSEVLEQMIANELVEVFRADSLGRLCSNEKTKIHISILKTDSINKEYFDIDYAFEKISSDKVKLETLSHNVSLSLVFIPVKEVLSFTTYLIDFYENYDSQFDKTYYDLMKKLTEVPIKKDSNKYKQIEPILKIIQEQIGGDVIKKENKFYIKSHVERESALVSEGQRKLALLYYLILTDNLQKGSILFWDEPDSSLNPKMIKTLAEVLFSLVQFGVQIFVTSHNLFFMREIDLLKLKHKENFPVKFFSFVKDVNQIQIEVGNSITDLSTIVSLDEALLQEDRREEILNE